MVRAKIRWNPKGQTGTHVLLSLPPTPNAIDDLQENLAPFHHHRATHAQAKEAGKAGGTDMVGVNGTASPGAAPNQSGELRDASVPDTRHHSSQHTNMAAALSSPSKSGTKCPLWPTLA